MIASSDRIIRCAGGQTSSNTSEAVANVTTTLSTAASDLVAGHNYRVRVTITGIRAFTNSGAACLGSGSNAFGVYDSKLTVLQNKV
jgi:hypothetical protein